MRHFYPLVLALAGAAALAFSSCVKAPELTLTSPTSIDLNVDGSSSTITFTANRDWTVKTSDSWVSISPSSGTASDEAVTVRVSCSANTTYEDRSATITITMEELSQTVSVKQPANLGIILPTQSYNLASDARTIDVEVRSNVQYAVSISDNWIKQTGTKGLVTDKLTFSVEENDTYDGRSATITIKPQNATVQEQVITVKQAQKDALIVKDTSFDMPYGGGEIEVKVEANVSFDVKPSEDWIHYVETKALSGSTVRLKVDENPTYSAREGKIEIKQKNGTLSHTLAVKQAGRIAVTSIELNKTSLTLKEGESETLTATVKPDNATDKTITWSSSAPSVAAVDEAGNVTAVAKGEATITAQAGEKTAKCVVIVEPKFPSGNISFVDLNIKVALVKAFDTNNDGEISYEEAASVTSLKGVFGDGQKYKSFDEFQFFVGLTIVETSLFEEWFNLSSIILPETIRVIQSNAFCNCYNLKGITFPETLYQIEQDAFYGCSALSGQLAFPNGLYSIGARAFSGCANITGDLIIPSTTRSIGEYAFSDCTGLNGRLALPTESPLTIGSYAFSNCANFNGDLIISNQIQFSRLGHAFNYAGFSGNVYIYLETVSKYYDYSHCKIGGNLIIEDNVTKIDGNAFRDSSVGGYVYIGKKVTSISIQSFYGTKIKSVYVAAPTPPTCEDENTLNMQGRYLGVPVGRSAVYKSAPYWKDAEIIEEVDFSSLKLEP